MNLTEDAERIERELHRSSGGNDPFAAAVRATRMPMLITDPRQQDNPIVFVNDAFFKLTGYTRGETLGRNCRFLQGPSTHTADVAKIRDAIARRESIEIDLLNYRKDGSTFWNRLLISPVFDGDELTFFFASQFDITPERESMSRLAKSRDELEDQISRRMLDLAGAEDRLKFTLAAGRLGAWTLELKPQRLVASAICKQMFGRRAADTMTYKDVLESILPQDRLAWDHAFDAALAGSGSLDVEFRISLPAGDIRWIEMRGQTSFDAAGRPTVMTGVSMEITDRKNAESERELLTREMSHRVKNTLATVQSIVAQSLRSRDVPADVVRVVSQRLSVLASANDAILAKGEHGAGMMALVANALRPFDADTSHRIHFGGDDISVSARTSTAITLAMHELATNALKYGALSNEDGKIVINWTVEADKFSLTWQEIGGPKVIIPTTTGFGSKMIEKALSASISGDARIQYRDSGVIFTIDAPLAGLVTIEDETRVIADQTGSR